MVFWFDLLYDRSVTLCVIHLSVLNTTVCPYFEVFFSFYYDCEYVQYYHGTGLLFIVTWKIM